MRSFFAVLLIFLGTLAYGSVFVPDRAAHNREIARLKALAITPPSGGGTLEVGADEENDDPILEPRRSDVFGPVAEPPSVAPAPAPTPSKNEFRIDDDKTDAAPARRSLASLLLGLIVTPAHAESAAPA